MSAMLASTRCNGCAAGAGGLLSATAANGTKSASRERRFMWAPFEVGSEGAQTGRLCVPRQPPGAHRRPTNGAECKGDSSLIFIAIENLPAAEGAAVARVLARQSR